MGLWHDIRALDALRVSVDSGAAKSGTPVSTGTASDNAHVEHIDVNSHFVPGVVTSRTVAADQPWCDGCTTWGWTLSEHAPWCGLNPFLLCDCEPGFAGTHKPERGYVRALYERDAR